MRTERLKNTVTLDELAWDIFKYQIAGEPSVAEWGFREYAEVCLNFIGVSYLPDVWLLALVDAVVKCKEGRA